MEKPKSEYDIIKFEFRSIKEKYTSFIYYEITLRSTAITRRITILFDSVYKLIDNIEFTRYEHRVFRESNNITRLSIPKIPDSIKNILNELMKPHFILDSLHIDYIGIEKYLGSPNTLLLFTIFLSNIEDYEQKE